MSARIVIMLAAALFAWSPMPATASTSSVRPCTWLSRGRLAYVDRSGLVVCSARAARRLTNTTDVRELVWSPDGRWLHANRVESPAWLGRDLAFISRERLFVVDATGTTHLRLSLAPASREAYYGDANTSDRYAWHS